MTVASLLILMGLGPWDPVALIIGIVIAVGVFVAAAGLAMKRSKGRPRPTWFPWLMGCIAGFYVVAAAAAAVAGGEYVLIALLAATIPSSAALLLYATTQTKGVASDTPDDDPYPGIGVDDATPVGDTPEHSDAREGTPVEPRSGQ
jgi:hypothetical protein